MTEQLFAPHKETKVWGSVTHIFTSSEGSMSILQVEKESWCSIHRHKERVNHFIVLSGNLYVLCFGTGEEPTDEATISFFLHAGMTHTVAANVWHQFYVKDSGSLIEVYWPSRPDCSVRHDDIERRTLGGRDNG